MYASKPYPTVSHFPPALACRGDMPPWIRPEGPCPLDHTLIKKHKSEHIERKSTICVFCVFEHVFFQIDPNQDITDRLWCCWWSVIMNGCDELGWSLYAIEDWFANVWTEYISRSWKSYSVTWMVFSPIRFVFDVFLCFDLCSMCSDLCLNTKTQIQDLCFFKRYDLSRWTLSHTNLKVSPNLALKNFRSSNNSSKRRERNFAS